MEAIFTKISTGELSADDKKGLRLQRDSMDSELNPSAKRAKPTESGEPTAKPAESGEPTTKPPQSGEPTTSKPPQSGEPDSKTQESQFASSCMPHFEAAFDKLMGDGPPMFS